MSTLMHRPRLYQVLACTGISFYLALLSLAALPKNLIGEGRLSTASLVASEMLKQVGIVPGIEVFQGLSAPRVVQTRACFRVTSFHQHEPSKRIVLLDQIKDCQRGLGVIFHDHLHQLMIKTLGAAMLRLNQGQLGDIKEPPFSDLIAVTQYYCELAKKKGQADPVVRVEYLSRGTDLSDKTSGEFTLLGQRSCNSLAWQIGKANQ
ncbi:MAG: hypothetical protein MK135_06450 [Polyangiaceae bacterium]|nr:hypothetical protein [Polyangiaceae bacterium]